MKLKKVLAVVLASVMLLCSVPLAELAGFAAENLPEISFELFAKAQETEISEETVTASGTCGENLTWVLYKNGTLVISGEGEMENFDANVPWANVYWNDNDSDYTYYIYVIEVIINDGVTSIGDSAFCEQDRLTSITIPDSVTSIGDYALFGCGLESITISESVTRIGDYAFAFCNSLEAITILNPECEIYDDSYTIDSGATIIGYAGSTAQAYAEEYNRTFRIICDHDFESVVAEPTCTTDGYTLHSCNLCGYSYKDAYVYSNGHLDENNDNICEVCGNNVSDILVGETKLIEIIANEITYLRFIPEYDGKYTFYSSSDSDTYGYLFDADKNQLTRNDDGDWDYNFSVTYELEAGVTYYWGARFYDAEESGSFNVTLECTEAYCSHKNTTEHEAVDATCSSEGYTAGVYCDDCDKWIEGHTLINRLPHTDENADNICEVCGNAALNIVDSGTCGEYLTWVLYENGTLVISGTGEMEDYDRYAPWENYSVTKIIVEDGVTSIGSRAFFSCDSLTSITIPESVTSIGDCAFSICDSLKSITIPDSVTSIGSSAFYSCNSLESIIVDENNNYYTSDAYGVLFNKNKTELIQYPAGKAESSYSIPESVTSIASYAFYGCYSLISITIPESVTSISDYMFGNCCKLESVTIPDTVTSIGSYAFYFCDSLEYIIIPASVTSIGDAAFLYADLLRITILNPECEIYDSLGTIDSGSVMMTIVGYPGSTAQAYAEKYNHKFEASAENPTWVIYGDTLVISDTGEMDDYRYDEVEDEVTTPWYPFRASIKHVCIEDGVTSIGRNAFRNCDSLASITIPNSVISIGRDAFYDCDSLASITIPESVTIIGNRAFAFCDSLEEITILNPECEIYDDWFTIASGATIIGYAGSTAQAYAESYDRVFKVIDEETDEHDFESVVTEPTCTEDGYTTHTCEDCGYSYVDSVVEALGHNAVSYTQSATCEVTGYVITTCSRCYEELDFEILDKLGHDWDDGVATTEATCMVKEEKLYTCKNDATHTKTEIGEVNPDNHTGGTYVENKMDATCVLDGYTGDSYCNACKQLVSNGTTIGKLGHNMGAWTVVKDATLLEEGQEKSKCTRCDYTETRSIPRIVGTKTEDDQSGVSVEYTSGAYEEDVVVKVEEVYDGSQYLTQQYTNIMSWNIKTYVGDTEVQPDEPVLVRLPLPSNYNESTVAVYHINSETGTRERVQPVIIEDGYICFFANSFSVYILVDESSVVVDEPSDPSANCDHMCHKDGFMGFIWKIVQFFWKLFKMNPVCECGAAHY